MTAVEALNAVLTAEHANQRLLAYLFVCQEKTPPYLVTVAEVDQLALRVGRELNRQAIDLYAKCVESNQWPGYSDDVELVGLPAWVERRYQGWPATHSCPW